MNYEIIESAYGILLGLLLGSFLNVVILRTPKRMFWFWRQEAEGYLHDLENTNGNGSEKASGSGSSSDKSSEKTRDDEVPPGIVKKRSFCPQCGHGIAWYDNIPLLSFLFLRGKCRHCDTPISWRYPLVEALCGLMGLGLVLTGGWTLATAATGVWCAVLVACAGIDWDHQIIPDDIVIPAIWGALLWSLTPWSALSPEQAIIGAAVGYGSLWLVTRAFFLCTGKVGMGNGDFKLLALMGGFLGASHLLFLVLVAAVLGLFAGVVWRIVRKESAPFAFGPWLAAAGVIDVLGGSSWFFAHVLGS